MTMKNMSQNWQLHTLINGVVPLEVQQAIPSNLTVCGIVCDSRRVEEGSLFFAVPGVAVDGAKFIPMAVEKGAAAIICDKQAVVDEKVVASLPVIRVDNIRYVLGQIAARFYPEQPEHIVAITGTNGKTSTAHFYQQLWHLLGEKSASVGTLGIQGSDAVDQLKGRGVLTTPDAIGLHKNLQTLAKNGVTHLALEASSHGLHQYRMHGVRIEVAIFTSFSRDHLDYHKTEKEYLEAKALLFKEVLPKGKVAILNADCHVYQELKGICDKAKHPVLSYGYQEGADLQIISIQQEQLGQSVVFEYKGQRYHCDIPLIGKFQIENLMAAFLAVISTGGAIDKVIEKLPCVSSVRGRMERVENPSGKAVIVDYAHTPDALEKALIELHPYVKQGNKLWVVFGCGGDRDKGKRPQMGKVAAENADVCVITDDNPRTESAEPIRKQILAACPGASEVADRQEAILFALSSMAKDDILLIAGKGHETYQIIGETYHDFDDAEVVRAYHP